MLQQTCAGVQEQKIKSADVNKEKIPEDFFESPAKDGFGLWLDWVTLETKKLQHTNMSDIV